MTQAASKNANGRPVAVIIGATSKWQADGRNTKLAHGKVLDASRCRSARGGASAARSRRSSQARASSRC